MHEFYITLAEGGPNQGGLCAIGTLAPLPTQAWQEYLCQLLDMSHIIDVANELFLNLLCKSQRRQGLLYL